MSIAAGRKRWSSSIRIGVYQRLLPFQAVGYLLHGLCQTPPNELPVLRENQAFLAPTLANAFQQAALALQVEPVELEQAIDALLQTVLNESTDA